MKSHLINHIHISNINGIRKYVKSIRILLISFQMPSVEMEINIAVVVLRGFFTQKKAASLSLGGGVAYQWSLSQNTTQEVRLAFD